MTKRLALSALLLPVLALLRLCSRSEQAPQPACSGTM